MKVDKVRSYNDGLTAIAQGVRMTIIPGLLETQQSHLTHTYASTHLRGGAVVSLHFTKEKVFTIQLNLFY